MLIEQPSGETQKLNQQQVESESTRLTLELKSLLSELPGFRNALVREFFRSNIFSHYNELYQISFALGDGNYCSVRTSQCILGLGIKSDTKRIEYTVRTAGPYCASLAYSSRAEISTGANEFGTDDELTLKRLSELAAYLKSLPGKGS